MINESISESYSRYQTADYYHPKTEETRARPEVDDAIKNTGVLPEHLQPLQEVARQHNCIIGIRPVDQHAAELIRAGHPTKGLNIKGKSASWGVQAGFICVDQRLSKLVGAKDEIINEYNEKINECIKKGHATAMDLTLSKQYLDNLLQKNKIDHFSADDGSGTRQIIATAPNDERYTFEAKKLSGEGDELYTITFQDSPVSVLGPDEKKVAPGERILAFTADYDLLMVSPHISDLSPQDNIPVNPVSYRQFSARYEKITDPNHPLQQYLNSSDDFYKGLDPEMGNASQRVRNLIPMINRALVGHGENVVHHGSDTENPATDESSNYPALFALPVKLGRFDELCVIENQQQLIELITEAKRLGYHVNINPEWDNALTSVRSPAFVEAKKHLDSHLPLMQLRQVRSTADLT